MSEWCPAARLAQEVEEEVGGDYCEGGGGRDDDPETADRVRRGLMQMRKSDVAALEAAARAA